MCRYLVYSFLSTMGRHIYKLVSPQVKIVYETQVSHTNKNNKGTSTIQLLQLGTLKPNVLSRSHSS